MDPTFSLQCHDLTAEGVTGIVMSRDSLRNTREPQRITWQAAWRHSSLVCLIVNLLEIVGRMRAGGKFPPIIPPKVKNMTFSPQKPDFHA